MPAIDYADIVAGELALHDIRLCGGCEEFSNSHNRGFAVPDERVIHYSAQMRTRSTLWGFLHEVGHIVRGHGKATKLKRYEREQEAEDYAREAFRAYGIPAPRKVVALGRRYVSRMKRWGKNIARGRRDAA